MSGLRLDDVGVRHDGVAVLRGVSLRVEAGESLCLIGASGSGKSLVAAAAAGLLPACMTASGRVTLLGRAVEAGDQAGLRGLWHSHLCLLPQEPTSALAPLLRAARQVGLGGGSRGEALEWLARFGLDRRAAGRMPFELSGGMAQRLLAALAMRTGSRVLIADEPTKGLDARRRAELVALLVRLRDAGRALLVISHDMEVVRALGGRVAVLEDGGIVEEGSAAEVLEAPRSAFGRACRAADVAAWAPRVRAGAGPAVLAGEGLVIGRGRERLAGPLGIGLGAGSVLGVLGPSGSGKTTLGDTVLGLVRPAGGRVSWFGRGLDRGTMRALRPRFQKLHQDPTTVFAAGQSVGRSFADLRRLPDGAAVAGRAAGLLDRLGLADRLWDRRPHELSGGEVQRFALARVLCLQPAVIVADEPSSRLDPPIQAAALRLLCDLVEQDGLAVMLVTHERAVADALADATIELGGAIGAGDRV